MLGRKVLKRDNADPEYVISFINSEFSPREHTDNGKLVYRIEVNGHRQVYRGGKEDVHYIDFQNMLYGGMYRYLDDGKKPHPEHWASIKFSVPHKKGEGR